MKHDRPSSNLALLETSQYPRQKVQRSSSVLKANRVLKLTFNVLTQTRITPNSAEKTIVLRSKHRKIKFRR